MELKQEKFYRPCHPQKTAPYQILYNHYDEFKNVYDKKYLSKYGPFRPIVDKTVERYLKCGIPKYGFARIKCTECGKEFLLPFFCKSRLCSSCMTKSMLQFQNYVMDEIIHKVPHRHMVFCLPKILRGGFIRNRELLNDLSRIVWVTVKQFMQETLQINGVPGSIEVIQTHGNLLNTNPHIHTFISDGLFTPAGTFYCMPSYSDKARKYLQILFEKNVCLFALQNNLTTAENIKRILKQEHTGFSVYIDTRINFTKYHPEEENKLSQILRYISKSFYYREKVVYTQVADKVLYKGTYHKGLERNFEYFTYTDFIASLTAHVPNRYQKYINYYGYYSSKNRGMRNKKQANNEEKKIIRLSEPTEEQKTYKKRWAQLIHQVFEVDPLICPLCGNKMRIIAYIDKQDVIKKILKHLNLWDEEFGRAPPVDKIDDIIHESFYA